MTLTVTETMTFPTRVGTKQLLCTNICRGGGGDILNISGSPHGCCRCFKTFEPPRGKTNNVVFEQVRHKLSCTSTEKS